MSNEEMRSIIIYPEGRTFGELIDEFNEKSSWAGILKVDEEFLMRRMNSEKA